MFEKTTKCALKRTSKAIAVKLLHLTCVVTAFLALAWVVGTAISIIDEHYPVMHQVFSFSILWFFAFVFLFLIVFGIYKEYEYNSNLCKQLKKEKKNG
jgi:membrane protein YdbS with pleckstrin-like domain